MDARTVQTLMGHKTLAMTERYTHLSSADKLRRSTAQSPGSETPTATSTATEEPIESVDR